MGKNKLKALGTANRSDWIKARFASQKRMAQVMEGLVWGCPVPGVAASGKCISAFQNKDDAVAAQILSQIFDGLSEGSIFHSVELRQVAKWLIDNGRDGNKIPNGSGEFFCFSESQTGVLKDAYGMYPELEKKELRANHRNPFKNLLVLDALFRHMRNSIAHGMFSEANRKGESGKYEPYYYFQDANASHQITARIFISYRRIELLCQLLEQHSIG